MGKWLDWFNGVTTKGSSGVDENDNVFNKSESLKGDDQNHDHDWVRTTRDPDTGRTNTQMGSSTKGSGYSGRHETSRDRDRENR